MCGIVGLLYKKRNLRLGETIIDMMQQLQHRGKDGAGVAIYGDTQFPENEYVMKLEIIRLGSRKKVEEFLHSNCEVEETRVVREGKNFIILDLRIRITEFKELRNLLLDLQTIKGVSVLSAGKFEMMKDLGTVSLVDSIYGISKRGGTHGIGHIRFSTESGVDRYHAHPFQSFVYPDVTVVHNGQITNYWKIRNSLEAKGHTFTTDNDTECIVHFVADMLLEGNNLQEALENSVRKLDGPFSFLISTANAIGIAKDKLGLRPALIAEDSDVFAIASEEVALEPIGLDTEYLAPGEIRVFER